MVSLASAKLGSGNAFITVQIYDSTNHITEALRQDDE